jgi:hypothetical protein
MQTVTVTDPNAGTTFAIGGCSGIVTTTAVSNGVLNVTSVATGSCTLTVSDAFSHQATIGVGVTTFGFPVQ